MDSIALIGVTEQKGLAKEAEIDWEIIFTIPMIERMIIECEDEDDRDVMIEVLERYVKLLNKRDKTFKTR